MASTSDILLLTYLATGESASGGFANWGEVAVANFAFLEDTVGEVTEKAVTSLDVTLTAAEERSLLIKATGVLTGNRSILTNDRKGFWFVRNDCTGAFTLTFKTTSGTGVVVPQGGSSILVSDGTDALDMGTRPREIGEIVDYAFATAPIGWLFLNADTVGSAASGATHANAGYSTLFTGLWDSMADAQAPVSGGRGASAAADFAANKTITLPDARGRVVAGQDDMGGVSANRLTGLSGGIDGDVLGGTGGLETHTITTAQLAAHTHTGPSHTHTFSDTATTGNASTNHVHGDIPTSSVDGTQQTARQGGADNGGSTFTGASGSLHTHSVTVSGTTGAGGTGASGSAGSGSAHNNVQPTIILNKIIYAGV